MSLALSRQINWSRLEVSSYLWLFRLCMFVFSTHTSDISMKIKPSDDSLVGPILLYLEKNVFSRQQIEPDLQL